MGAVDAVAIVSAVLVAAGYLCVETSLLQFLLQIYNGHILGIQRAHG